MKIAYTHQFGKDSRGLPKSLEKKCDKLIKDLNRIEPADLRQQVLPGWRLHRLRGSRMVSLSLDKNFRVLAELDANKLILHRAVKHKLADRPNVNRNDQAEDIAQTTTDTLHVSDVYDSLLSFGISQAEAEYFRECSTEDELLNAAENLVNAAAENRGLSEKTAELALTLYETSGLLIPQAQFRFFQKDDDLARIVETGGVDWEMYLHISQSHIVELPPSFRTAVVGSAGTGKTVCAWYRSKHLIDSGVSVGFVCPHKSVLDISKQYLLRMVGDEEDRSYFFVPKQPDELVQLADVVGHVIIDEAQEIPTTWLVNLATKMRDTVGITLFYDLNQLGGNIQKGDLKRYRRRISDWKAMLSKFPRVQKFTLTINYRNAREIAEYYLRMLSEVLPAKPLADVPVFESGEVVQHKVKSADLNDTLASLLHRLSKNYSPRDIGVVILSERLNILLRVLSERQVPVTKDPKQNAVVVTTARKIRGHERQVMIVVSEKIQAQNLKIGVAIDAYIAMSRAIKQLIVIEAIIQ